MTAPAWWQRLPSRLLREEAALQDLRNDATQSHLTYRWEHSADGDLRISAQVVVFQRVVDLEVRFPAHYPEGCPSVRPVPYDKPISGHQFLLSGILCLEIGPDNWHPTFTAADLIRSALKLAAYERLNEFEPIDIPSRHESTLSERVRLAGGVLLRSAEFDARLGTLTAGTEFEAVRFAPGFFQVLPISMPKDSPLATPPAIRDDGVRLPAQLVQLREGVPPSSELPDEPASFASFTDTFGGFTPGDAMTLVLLRWPDAETRGYLRSSSLLVKLADMPLGIADATRTPAKLHVNALNLRIGVVGLGSLGSKVAVSLSRSGVRRFVLVDGEVMRGENVCRHQAAFRDVGLLKVHVANRLLSEVAAADVDVKTFAVHVGAATDPEYHAAMLEELASCDVLVDATANPETFGVLAGVASNHRRALVWGEVFSGGLGGLVGSAHPKRDPCPRCVRAGFLALAQTWPPAPDVRPTAEYAAANDPVLVASDADVSLVAAALTTRIYQLVDDDESPFPAVLVLGLRRGWIFDAIMQTVPVQLRIDDWSCEWCWRPAADVDEAATAAAERLLASHADAHDRADT